MSGNINVLVHIIYQLNSLYDAASTYNHPPFIVQEVSNSQANKKDIMSKTIKYMCCNVY